MEFQYAPLTLRAGAGQKNSSFLVVAQKSTGVKGTPLHIARQITQRRFPFSDSLQIDVPLLGGAECSGLFVIELTVDFGVSFAQSLLHATTETSREREVVHEELTVLFWADEFLLSFVKSDGGNEDVDVTSGRGSSR